MNSIEKIIKEVNLAINNQYRFWYIGIAENPQLIKKSKDYPKCFQYWESISIEESEKVEAYFKEKGCLICSLRSTEIHKNKKAYIYIY